MKQLLSITQKHEVQYVNVVCYRKCMLIFNDETRKEVLIRADVATGAQAPADMVQRIQYYQSLLDNVYGLEKKPKNYPRVDRNDMDILCFLYMGDYYRQKLESLIPK